MKSTPQATIGTPKPAAIPSRTQSPVDRRLGIGLDPSGVGEFIRCNFLETIFLQLSDAAVTTP
jgi:hypothetical protein